jgi:hypothetical protein
MRRIAANGAAAAGFGGGGLFQLVNESWLAICDGDCPSMHGVWPRDLDDLFVAVASGAPDFGIEVHHWTPSTGLVLYAPTADIDQATISMTGHGDTVFIVNSPGGDVGVATPGTMNVHESSLRAVAPVSDTEAFAVGDDGLIEHFQDGTWTTMASPTTGHLSAVVALGPSNAWAVGGFELVHFDGSAWTIVEDGAGAASNLASGATGELVSNFGSSWAAYYDGTGWLRIGLPIPGFGMRDVGLTRARITTIIGNGPTHIYHRYRPWTGCAATETVCDDRVDDDCDGYLDHHDSDCLP